MLAGEELVAVYDADGQVVGSAPRRRVRAEGLWHAATMVLVRSVDGSRVYVHRRSLVKDIYPGMTDCFAGGVVDAGEHPDDGAVREVAEELGITGAPLTELFTFRFEQPPLRCHYFVYEVRWDGPLVHQPEEIIDGAWVELPDLIAALADPDSDYVPDGRQIAIEWLNRLTPHGESR
ncbi:NUDIX domain-containing protein [Kutzneria viridogrisea]|uniref:Nudix hydrolase domain-containing protein n=1 Tax=Kutzneria albida DSM 43870 TaxID=1449976 RepID=W5W793_9PSEU|nr:hypothetical protein KALB_3043 [Kutzneria albida DSM 43870]